MESIIKDNIVRHLESNKVIKKSQHGFKTGRSCATNLLEFFEPVTEASDRGKPVDLVYLDFAKAFDKVPHGRLLKKIEAAGISGNLLAWIRDWLTNRQQRVVIKGKFSGWAPVLSGVPQGSVLGPVLFNILINNLDSAVTADQILKKFADDSKLGQVINGPGSAAALQTSLDNLYNWSVKWGMEFNTGKCHVMHVCRNNPTHAYTMGSHQLAVSSSEKDVGVMISDSLKPSEQCRKAATTANAVLSQIQRAFHYRDRHTYVKLYVQYVRPHLEFESQAWAPWTSTNKACLEKVQERAIRAVSGLKSATYSERLRKLNLQSLEDRRLEADMVLTHHIRGRRAKSYAKERPARVQARIFQPESREQLESAARRGEGRQYGGRFQKSIPATHREQSGADNRWRPDLGQL
jgi:hypothetical protein